MKKQLSQVAEFHKAFRVTDNIIPTMLPHEQAWLRFQLLEEENKEYLNAESKKEILDACADILYIAFGTILQHGLQDVIEEAFDRVHASNMSKLGPDGQPIVNGENGVFDESRPMGKILKSDNYKPVDLNDLV